MFSSKYADLIRSGKRLAAPTIVNSTAFRIPDLVLFCLTFAVVTDIMTIEIVNASTKRYIFALNQAKDTDFSLCSRVKMHAGRLFLRFLKK